MREQNPEYCLFGIVLNNIKFLPKISDNIFLDKKTNELYVIVQNEIKRSGGIVKDNLVELLENNVTINKGDFYEIYDSCCDDTKFEYYYNYVVSKWAVIQAEIAVSELRNNKYTSISDVKKNFQELTTKLNIDANDNIVSSKEIIINRLKNFNKIEPLIKSHIDYIDNFGGLSLTDFVIIAARPGVGKSTRMYNMILQDMYNNIPVLVFSLEAKKEKIVTIIGCISAGLDTNKVRNDLLSETEKTKYINAYEKVYEKEVFFDDTTNQLETIRRHSINTKEQKGIRKIYIDYLGLLETAEGKTRYEKVSHISRELKKLSMDLDAPVIALHQLNRDSEDRADKRPQLADLRDSGSIEQDADIVCLLHPIILDVNQRDDIILEHIFPKFREGATGIAKYQFHKPTRRIKQLVDTRNG